MMSHALDHIIEKGILFLLIFSPLAFGSVQDWSAAVLEITAFTVVAAWALKQTFLETPPVQKQAFLWFGAAFLVLAVIQILPLPAAVLTTLSPSLGKLSRDILPDSGLIFGSLSIAPGLTMDELFKLLAYAGIFFVAMHHYQERRQIERAIWAMIGTGVFVTVVALAQNMTWNGRLYWIYPVDPSITSNTDYIWGPYINHNHFAGYLEMVMPLGFGMFLYLVSKARGTHHRYDLAGLLRMMDQKNASRVVMAALGAVVMAAGIVICLSRGGILGASAAIVVLLAMARSRKSLKKTTAILLAGGAILVSLFVIAAWDRIEDRFSQIGQEQKIIRPDIWRDALGIVKDFPLLGTGLGTFGRIDPKYQTKYSTLTFEHAENDYIELLTDTGAVGIAIAIGAVMLYLRAVYGQWKERKNIFAISIASAGVAAVSAILVHSFTDFNSRIPANMITLAVIAGMTYAVVFNYRRSFGRES